MIYLFILTAIVLVILIGKVYDIISWRKEIKADKVRDEKVDRLLSEDPSQEATHPSEWQIFAYRNHMIH